MPVSSTRGLVPVAVAVRITVPDAGFPLPDVKLTVTFVGGGGTSAGLIVRLDGEMVPHVGEVAKPDGAQVALKLRFRTAVPVF